MVYSKIKVTLKDLLLYLLIVTCYHAYLSLYKKGKVTLCPALDLDIIDEHLVVGLFSVDAEPEPEFSRGRQIDVSQGNLVNLGIVVGDGNCTSRLSVDVPSSDVPVRPIQG